MHRQEIIFGINEVKISFNKTTCKSAGTVAYVTKCSPGESARGFFLDADRKRTLKKSIADVFSRLIRSRIETEDI